MKIRQTQIRPLFLTLLITIFLGIADKTFAEDLPSVLVLRPDSRELIEVRKGFEDDLAGYVNVSETVLTKNRSAQQIEQALKRTRPAMILVLGNGAINMYRKYQERNPDRAYPPAILTAALFVDQLVERVENATGILYEIPLVTSVRKLRGLVNNEIASVGVIHREWMTSFIEQNRKFAKSEAVELRGITLPDDGDFSRLINKGLEKLLDDGVDAIWIVNDNRLLTATLLMESWIPTLRNADLPVIVGVEPLVRTRFHLGMFASVPDLYALGAQSAGVAWDIMDAGFSLEGFDAAQPLSIETIFNRELAEKKGISVISSELGTVKRVIGD